MNIKHFQGYGKVSAKKVSKTIVRDYLGDEYYKLVIEVSGNHEWGLHTIDLYDAYRWLVTKFDKSVKSEREIVKYEYEDCGDFVDGKYLDKAKYTFYYKK